MFLAIILLIITISLISLFLVSLIHAFWRSIKSIPLLSRVFFGFILITIFLIDYILSSFSYEYGIIYSKHFYKYQYIYYVLLGIVGFYFSVDILLQKSQKKIFWKTIVLLIGSNFITAISLILFFIPELYYIPAGLQHFRNTNIPIGVRAFIIIAKGFGILGLTLFLLQVSILVIKSKIFSKFSTILLIGGILILLNGLITIPLIGIAMNLSIEILLFHWILTFIFIVAARLNRINFKIFMDIKELHFIYQTGITLFSISNSHYEPTLVGSAMTGICTLIQEIWGSHSKVRSIDKGDKKILFAFGKYSFVMILVEEDSLILNKMLKILLNNFESKFESSLKFFVGDVSMFQSSQEIINSVFSQVEWNYPTISSK